MRPPNCSGQPALGLTQNFPSGSTERISRRMRSKLVGPARTVDPDHIRAIIHQSFSHLARIISQQGTVIAREGHRSDNRNIRIDILRGADRFAHFIFIGNSFHDQQIHLAASTRDWICCAKMPRASSGCTRPKGARRTPIGPTSPAISTSLKLKPDVRFARQLNSGGIDLIQLIGQAVLAQFDRVRAKGVGEDDLRAGIDVFTVHISRSRPVQSG